MNKSAINTAVTIVLTLSTMVTATTSSAVVNTYSWDGVFTALDSEGVALINVSQPNGKSGNNFQTPISGTMAFDTVTGAGTATIDPFDFWLKTTMVDSFNIQSIGDGMGGSGSLVLGNMLYSWGGIFGTPVSVVLDAQGFFAGDLGGGGLGAVPASDGTYVGATIPDTVVGPGGYAGYLGLGPVPIATTAWNTTDNCTSGVDCFGAVTSGVMPLLFDDANNLDDYTINTGGNIGGSPNLEGSFAGSNFNFDFTALTLTGTSSGTIGPFDVGQVPIPSAVWLFGSGLIGLIGIARRKKA